MAKNGVCPCIHVRTKCGDSTTKIFFFFCEKKKGSVARRCRSWGSRCLPFLSASVVFFGVADNSVCGEPSATKEIFLVGTKRANTMPHRARCIKSESCRCLPSKGVPPLDHLASVSREIRTKRKGSNDLEMGMSFWHFFHGLVVVRKDACARPRMPRMSWTATEKDNRGSTVSPMAPSLILCPHMA